VTGDDLSDYAKAVLSDVESTVGDLAFFANLERELSPDDLIAVDVIHQQLWVLYPTEETSKSNDYREDVGALNCAMMIVTSLKKVGVKMSVGE
jgi:hypothetical protein